MGQINLPGRLNFQTTSADLEFQNALSKIVYQARIPTPYRYPKAPYALSGLGANCLPYDFYALQAAFGVVDCGAAPYNSDPSTQYSCQQKNQPLLNQIAALSPSFGTCITPDMVPASYNPSPVSQDNPYLNPFSGPGLLYNPANPATPSSGIQYIGPMPLGAPGIAPITTSPAPVPASPALIPNTPAAGQSYSPRVVFTPSRQGILLPGDTWTIQITGGTPRTSVSVYGGPNGNLTTNTMGTTDQNGVFQLSGTIDSTMVGQSWQETWSVGGQNAGSFSFSIGTPTSPTTSPTSGPTGGGYTPPTPPPPSGTGQPAGGTTQLPATSSTWIPGISNTVVGIGAGALLLLVFMGGRR